MYHPTFVWESVGDIYHLQVSTDSSFASTIVNEEELTDTTYTPEDTLEEARYYWRVRAKLDTWGEWSDIGSFFVVESPPGLISPPDADTVKFPTLIWNPYPSATSYHLYIYQGDITAGVCVLDTLFSDTSYTITDTFEPATYRWWINALMGEEEIPYPEIRRFVTYTLDETFFPVGPNYVWECMRISGNWTYYSGNGSYDTSFYSIEVKELNLYEDSLEVVFTKRWNDQSLDYSYAYRSDSVYYFYDEYTEIYHGIGLFPEDGDRIFFSMCGPDPIPIHMTSDSTFWYGWPESYDFGWNEWYEMYYKRGVGNTEYNSGFAQIYHGDPTQSYGEDYDYYLINLDKGE